MIVARWDAADTVAAGRTDSVVTAASANATPFLNNCLIFFTSFSSISEPFGPHKKIPACWQGWVLIRWNVDSHRLLILFSAGKLLVIRKG